MSTPRPPADDDRAPGCACLAKLNDALARQGSNTVIGDSLIFSLTTGRTCVVAEIATYKRDPKNREKKCNMIPTFCPFCGNRYADEPEEETP